MHTEAIAWLALVVILFVIEGMTFNLICAWFAGGAIAALVASLLRFSKTVQFAVFVVVSALLLLLLRPVAKKMLSGKKVRTNADRVIGQTGIVIKRIDPVSGEGQIKVIGQIWSAKPEDGVSAVDVGRAVEVTGIAGVKVLIKECV